MFSWMSKEENRKRHTDVYDNVTVGLQNVYKKNLLPLEKEYNFHDFHRYAQQKTSTLHEGPALDMVAIVR
jgi:hypothetical protein